MSGKPIIVAPEGEAATSEKTPEQCRMCCKEVEKLESCPKCNCNLHCSADCMKGDESHPLWCSWICRLQRLENQKRMKQEINMVDAEKLPLNMKLKLVKLVGERPLVNIHLNKKKIRGLWDTGAMISLMSRKFLEENFPEATIHSIKDFTGQGLSLTAANKSRIDVDGVVILEFGVSEEGLFQVPFLISSQEISSPIIGYNTIEHLVRNFRNKINVSESLCELVECLASSEKADAMVQLIEEGTEIQELNSEVRLGKSQVVEPGCCLKVKCRFNDLKICGENKLLVFSPFEELCVEGDLVAFESVEVHKSRKKTIDVMLYNPTSQKMYLQKGKVLGQVSNAAAAYTLPILQNSASVGEVQAEEGEKETKDMIEEINLGDLEETDRESVRKLLEEEADVFSRSKNDIGFVPDFELDIKLTDEAPFGEAYRKIPGPLYQEVKNHINDLLANGWIRHSYSPYASPMVCVRKKDGGMRLCIDFRKLNSKTIPDMQPIPRVQDILDRLHGQKWFSTLDMSQAYHQGMMSESSRKFTAFTTPWALFEWVRIPYGICNAPAGFQRFINTCLAQLSDEICVAYLDDILVYSKDVESHKENLRKVLQCLRKKGVKLNLKKCNFFRKEIRYLGRLVSENGYRPDPEDTIALEKCKVPPTDVGKLRALLGFLGYYRTYIKDFSRKMKPIYDLLQKTDDDKPKAGKRQLDSKRKIIWTAELQAIVEEVVEYLKSPNVIAYPDFERPFIVHTDASQEGLGAALYQVQDEQTRIVSLASRTLTPAEKNYFMHSGKLEFLALKWAVTEKFHDYLINGKDFEVVTDNNPLLYVLTTAKLHATGLRWVASLANYRFTIRYRSGKKHVDADYLSRNVIEDFRKLREETDKVVTTEDMGILLSAATRKEREVDINLIHVNSIGTDEVDGNSQRISKVELRQAQLEDEVIKEVYGWVEGNLKVTAGDTKTMSRDGKILVRQLKKLEIVDGVLKRKTANFTQIVLPAKYHKLVFKELHNNLGHLGADRVHDLARKRFYWPRMKQSIEKYVTKQCRCIMSKIPNNPDKAPLSPITTTYPLELLTIDFVHLDKSKGNYNYALVCCDHFTKFVQIYATKTKKGIAAADKVYNEFILKFGAPTRIHSDQGGDFINGLFKRLHQLTGTAQSRTTPYHPQGNGLTERMNRTLIGMLKTLEEEEKVDWARHLPKLAYAYNVTVSKSTGFSPYFLLFGKEPRLSIDSVFEIEENPKKIRKSYETFAENWKESMNQAFQIAREHSEKAGQANKQRYDKKSRGVELELGDRVLTRNREKGGTGKLKAFWEHKVYTVVEKDPDIPVIVIKPEGGGKKKRVHRNDLLRCNLILPAESDGESETAGAKKNIEKKHQEQKKRNERKKDPKSEKNQGNLGNRGNSQGVQSKNNENREKFQKLPVTRSKSRENLENRRNSESTSQRGRQQPLEVMSEGGSDGESDPEVEIEEEVWEPNVESDVGGNFRNLRGRHDGSLTGGPTRASPNRMEISHNISQEIPNLEDFENVHSSQYSPQSENSTPSGQEENIDSRSSPERESSEKLTQGSDQGEPSEGPAPQETSIPPLRPPLRTRGDDQDSGPVVVPDDDDHLILEQELSGEERDELNFTIDHFGPCTSLLDETLGADLEVTFQISPLKGENHPLTSTVKRDEPRRIPFLPRKARKNRGVARPKLDL